MGAAHDGGVSQEVNYPKGRLGAYRRRRICLQLLAYTCISHEALVQEADSSDPARSSLNGDSAVSLVVGGCCAEISRRHINGASHLPGKL